MSARTLVAGVDTSTSACKIVVLDAHTGEQLRFGKAPHPEGTSVDPEAWWVAFLEAAHQAGGLDDVSSISVGGQQQGMVLLGENGLALRDAILWNDVRSSDQAKELTLELGARGSAQDDEPEETAERGRLRWLNLVGSALVPSLILTKLRWLLEHEPQHAANTAAVCLPHDWLSWRIAGNDPHSGHFDLNTLFTDRSDAAGTAYFDTVTNTYLPDLLDLGFGRHDVILPRVLAPREWTLKADPAIAGADVPGGCTIAPGGGDNALAAFALNMGAGDISVSIGTSGVVAAVADERLVDPAGLVNGFADVTGRFLPALGMFNSSHVLDAARAVLSLDYAAFDEAALTAPAGARGLTLIPYFSGERVPPHPDERGRLEGLTLANCTPSNVARAYVEGLLCNLNDSIEIMKTLTTTAKRVLLIGGGSRSLAVQRIAPTVFGMDVTAPASGEYVAIGAARQAAWVLSDNDDPPHWSIPLDATYTGPHEHEVYARYVQLRG